MSEWEIDPGLPQLTRGLFYRVTRTGMGFWEVQIRRHRKFWFSKKEESRMYGVGSPITPDNILAGSAQALDQYMNRDPRTGGNSLLGDYPR